MKEKNALIVLDIQTELLNGVADAELLIRNVNELIDAYHAKDLPVCFVRHTNESDLKENSPGWQIAESLHRKASDVVVNKYQGDAFIEQDMRNFIREEGVCIVTVVGLMTHACVQKTCSGALGLGLGTVLISDAHNTNDKSPQAVIDKWNSKLLRKGAAVITTDAFLAELTD